MARSTHSAHRTHLGIEALEDRMMPAAYTLFAAGDRGGSADPGNVELWRTDGTAKGTKLVKDINPGGASSSPQDLTYVPQMKAWYFTADNGKNGRELWRSNGNADGTKMVMNVNPADQVPGFPSHGLHNNTAPFLTYCNGFVFFCGNGGPEKGGIELWRTDGTKGGTKLVANIRHREEGSVPAKLCAVGNTLFFVADDGFTQRELWKTDGTAAGTKFVKDVNPGNKHGDIMHLTEVNGKLFFAAHDDKFGQDLWISDGTEAGTRQVRDVGDPRTSGIRALQPRWLTSYKGKCYFAGDDEEHGRELWVSDGTSAGTKMVKDVVPNVFDEWGSEIQGDGHPNNLIVCKDELYFTTITIGAPEHGMPSGSALWKSDGTTAGTKFIKQINDVAFDSEEPYAVHLEPMRFTVAGDLLYFIAGTKHDPLHATNENVELWRTDGTSGGTNQVKDIFPYNFGSSKPSKLREVNGKLVFFAYTEDHGREIWASNGTEAGTLMLKDVNKTKGPSTTYGQGSESRGFSFGQYQWE